MAERSPGTDSTFYVPRGTHCGSSQPSGLSGGNDDTSSSAKHCQNGLLQLRFTSLQDSQSFTYATLPGVNLTPLDWKICCAPDSDLPSEHVTYYQLTDAEKCLVDVVEEQCYVKSDVIGLIIINYNSSIYLSKEMFKKGVPKKPPMYVVALEDGEQIVEFFNTKVDDGDMMVKVLVDSDVDSVNYGPEGKISHDILKAHETGFHLHEELKRLMLNNRERIHILGAATSTFQFIFSCFQNYEAQPKRDSHNKTITKLLDNFKDGMFPKDFLFYLLVAYRLALYAKKYNSDDIIHTYLCHCIENFESLTDIQRVAEIIHSFVQRGNFTVQWYPYYQKADCAVFTLLCRMAEAMLIQSMKLKEVNNVAVYPRILWISLNLFFGLQSNIQPATLSNIWFTGLINETVLEKQKFSDQIAADFEKGFKFCQLLKLPKNALFDASSFATFLDPLKCKGLRFSHITKLIEAGVSFLSWDETFLLSFLAPLRSHYETLFLKHKDRHAVWDGCSGDNTKLGVYKEAVQFIIYLYKFSSNESEKASDMAKAIGVEIQKFLDLLINNVDLKADNAVDILKVLRNTSLPPKYRKIVMSVANQRGLEEIKQMKLTQICSLFKGNLHIWNFQFVEMFLNSYPIPSKADLTDSSWSLLLCEIIKRFSNITCKICVVGLLKRVGDAYKDDKKQHIFVSDLMKLNVPNLLLVPEDDDRDVEMAFIKIIQTFIQENGLHEVIIDQLLSILDAVKPGNHFQSLLLTVLQKEIIPNMYINEGSASYISKQLIVRSSVSVSKTVTTLSALSSIEKFYWNFIALCCCRIHVGVKDLQKLSRFAFAIENLSSIYSAYCNKRSNVSQPLCEVPEEIKHTDVREYFKWIIMMQRVLIYWQELFAEQAYNYEDILLYTEALPTIDKLAKSLNITHLVYEIDQIKVLKAHYYEHYAKCCSLMVKRSNDVDGSTTLVEMLDIYGVKLNHTLQDLLETHVVFPKDNSLVYASDVQNLRQAHQHELAQEEVLLLKQSVTSNILVKLFKELETFIEPISSKLEFFVYFYVYDCELFSKYLKYQLAVISSSQHPSDVSCSLSDNSEECFVEPDEKIVQFAEALRKTEEFILSLIKGTAKHEEIVAEKSIWELLLKLDVDKEFKIMCGFPEFQMVSSENKEGKEGIKNMLELFQCSQQISLIPNVCEQYGLTNCVNDDNLKELKRIANTVNNDEDRGSITGKDATEKIKQIWEMLNFKSYSEAKRCLNIFPEVAKCAQFYKFLREKGFTDEKSSRDAKGFTGEKSIRDAFTSQVQLITAQLQHEDYNETVLNHLTPAFEYIAPFLDTNQNFTDLMVKITKLFNDGVGFGDSRKDFCQLETVNSNITMIQLWFSRTEGDTLDNVSKELECIMNTGCFQLVIVPSKITEVPLVENAERHSSCKILLYYEPIKELSHRKFRDRLASESSDTEKGSPGCLTRQSSCLPEIWNREQIDDFVRKLGFLEAQKLEHRVKIFQQLNQTAQALYNTMLKLRNLGHPEYFKKTEIVQCNGKLEEAQKKVNDTEKRLKDWKTIISALYNKYNKLLFFSVSKVLSIYEILKNKDFCADKLMQEIGFLFKNDDEAMKALKVVIENFRSGVVSSDSPQPEDTPVAYVGKYLEYICSDSSVEDYFLCSRSQPTRLVEGKELLPFQEVVHFAPDYDNGQLLRLLIEIYNGVPEAYEVFHCSEDSTEEDLRLFLHRASTFKNHTFTILEVNKLPYRLQEVILHHHSQEAKELESTTTHLNYIETVDSVLHEMPWIIVKEYKKDGPNFDWSGVKSICERVVNKRNANFVLELVHGNAGDGKTHYIRKQLCDPYLIIAVNERFSVLNAISKLRMLPLVHNCTIFFNFTVVPPPESISTSEEKTKYEVLMDTLAWFFFKLLVFGYVEDLGTGIAFQLPGGLHWKICVEVPSKDADISLEWFQNKIAVFHIIGIPVLIDKTRYYDIDKSVQLVCKYLHAYDCRSNVKIGINKLYDDATDTKVRFGDDPDLEEEECYDILNRHFPPHVKTSKMLQQLFIKYMERRCRFLEQFPAFNHNSGFGVPFNEEVAADKFKQMVKDGKLKKLTTKYCTNTSNLGEVLMETMLQEVSEFCQIDLQQSWTTRAHQQLVYEVTEGFGTIRLITLKPNILPKNQVMRFKDLGVEIPSLIQLMQREQFDSYLSSALGVPLNEAKRLQDIDESHYVLTLDYTMKMLNIHERRECGVPVIIEGETGVGKTALIEMLSKLWNHALFNEWRIVKGRIVEHLYKKSQELEDRDLENSLKQIHTHGWHFDKQSQSQNRNLSKEDLIPLLDEQNDTPYFKFINKKLLELIDTAPILELIEIDVETESQLTSNVNTEDSSIISKLIKQTDTDSSALATAKTLCTLLNGNLLPTFHKLNIHAALTPKKVEEFFAPIIKLATKLKNKANELRKSQKTMQLQEPLVTVFLDELNTSCCMGLFKEMIVDKSFEGKPLPSNIFLVAACNPHRGNSLAVHGYREHLEVHANHQDGPKVEAWFRGSYYVQKLHPTLKFLMWKYGSLNDKQERDYIKEKMTIVNKEFNKVENIKFSELVVKCQELIRGFAEEQLRRLGVNKCDAKRRAASCISQRDIQRVFTFYCWIIKSYKNLNMKGHPVDDSPATKDDVESLERKQRALLVALGLVYYMRLDTSYRIKFVEEIDQVTASYNVKFKRAFTDEMDFYTNNLSLPTGIAKTEALKENLFATIICTVTNTPLIIVGAPGSSKTLSFNLTISNLKGSESKEALFRNIEVFKSLDPHYYQCSRRTTSTEIETVFQRAINRQHSHDSISMPIRCVVFMDEAGLPEESHESLKVLHYHLDQREVAFVGITNHVLDAAKTNRAVSLFRPTASQKDLEELAKGCLSDISLPDFDLKTVEKFCGAYYTIMQDKQFNTFFGLRDFIHFINYIRRKRKGSIASKLVLQSLERNFNGTDNFKLICMLFIESMNSNLNIDERNIVDILHDSLHDKPHNNKKRSTQNEVRYKLIIDQSKDESITRLLFMFDILKREKTRTYMCSNFPGDNQLQKINTIAAIRHSAIEGHTVIMVQTDDIHESFYDLFNQHFRRIDDPKVGPRYFTNIAIGAHTKPSRVHQDFQCIVVIKESEIKNTPAPFLNRFEKYSLSHTNLLKLVLNALPPCLKIVVNSTCKKVESFYSLFEENALYGAVKDTVCSLLLSILPRPRYKYKEALQSNTVDDTTKYLSKRAQLLYFVQKSLHEMYGFCYMQGNAEEIEHDAYNIVQLLANAGPKFSNVAKTLDSFSLSEISQWVSEAMKLIYKGASPPDLESDDCEEFEILGASDGACMVTALIAQWLVRFMCKKLMQLMTPEAAILKRKSIPVSYLETYLNFQSHFSINQLIAEKIQILNECNGDKIATKLICYTRSSSLVHHLPTVHPKPTDSTTPEDQTTILYIEAVIYHKADHVFLCKLSGISSQTSFMLQLQSFKDSLQQTVFVLVVNMKETNSQIINHIRIMIEEVDFSNGNSKKLFVLLLHFPPTMFYEPCYPALFLYGWDYYYLDTISHSDLKDEQPKEVSVVNIREWFTQSCLSAQETSLSPIMNDSMGKKLLQLLKKSASIQVIASRILLTVDSSQLSLDNAPDIAYKYGYLRKLLIDKKVGSVLCSKFKSYWKPSVIGNHLEQAARFCKDRKSTLSISDSVDSVCKTAFFNFVAYMIYQISKSRNLQLLFSSHCDDATLDLFLKLLDAHPVPELPEIKAYNITLDCRTRTISRYTSIPQFPFFSDVSTYISSLIQQNVDEFNESISILQENEPQGITAGLLTEEQIFKNLYQSLCSEIEALKKDDEKYTIKVAIMEMQSDQEIWQKYYNDFVNQYLHMSGAPDDIEHKLLQITLADKLNNYKEMKAVALHCYIYLHQLDIAKVVALLKPLAQLKDKTVRDEQSLYLADPQQSLIAPTQASKSVQESIISKYVIDSLFAALIDILYGSKKLPLLQEWYKSYRDLMKMSIQLTAILEDQHLKAKYHLTQTTFVILQLFDCVTDVTADCAYGIATYFCEKFFNDKFQLKEDEPLNLESIVNSFDLAVQGLQFSEIREKQLYHHITDGIFMQFFPESRKIIKKKKEETKTKIEQEEPYNKEDIEFFMKFANDKVPFVQEIPTQLKKLNDETSHCISLSKFKSYLDKILSKGWSEDRRMHTPLNFYKFEVCICIGKTILSQCAENIPDNLGYVPLYLQQTEGSKCSSSVMQQKLAHLYFYTVLEKLQTLQYTPSDLISFIHAIDKKKHNSNVERVILVIERQALIEVLLQVIVNRFHKDDEAAMNTLMEVSKEINDLVANQSHYDIMLMHLIKMHHGPRGVLNVLSEEKKEWWGNLKCFECVQKMLENSSAATSHLFPFIVGSTNHQFTSMYREICDKLITISKGYTQGKKKKFLAYVKSMNRSSCGISDKMSSIRMMIWLCVYHEFYCRKEQNHELVLLFEASMEDLKLSNEHVNLLKCFLNPTNMTKEEEIPNPLNPDAVIYEETRTGEVRRIAPSGNVDKHDAIWEFFHPSHDEDPSDIDLRHALANMIAVVFALPSHSNHIWYHMFCPGELEDSYMTGFMYPYTVKTGGLKYDCGCELNEDGQYGRKVYIPHATRGTLSLHSWYLMLWTNFGAFCVGLLTQPNVVKQISGHILSDQISIREYCMTQLKTVWLHMRTNFVCSDDERSFFIMKSMYTLLMLYQDGKLPFSKGRFDDMESLDTYEKTWHTSIYVPSKTNLQVELENHSSDSIWMLPALKKYRILNQHYPHLVTENEYMKSLVAAKETHNLNDEHLFVLHRFTLEHDRLQLGGALLPDLVKFYQWIHTHLSHLVTYKRAQEISIGDVIKLSAKRYSHENLTDFFQKFIKKYNDYLKTNGGIIGEATCDRTAKPTDARRITEKTHLIKFLSHESEDVTKYDWLSVVLMDITEHQNSFLTSVFDQAKSSNCHYLKYLPDSPPESYIAEVTSQNCIVPSDGDTGKLQFLKLIKSHYLYNGVQSSPLFDLDQLEQNVVAFYIAGKPQIQLDSIRTIFRFRNSPNNPGCPVDVSSVAQELPSKFKEPLQKEKRKALQYHFRTASFQILTEVATGLRTILGHLSQVILQQETVMWESILDDNLGPFLKKSFNKDSLQQAFHEIGIQHIDDTQLAVFEDIQLKRMFNCAVLFIEWLQGGLYDFSSLPDSVFKHMNSEDQEFIQRIPNQYPSAQIDLLSDLDQFEKTLNHAETYFTKNADPRKSIIETMVEIGVCEFTEKFVALVPRSILVYHYVDFRMTLRKLKLNVTTMIDSQPQSISMTLPKWSEIIEDLWKYLPHFQEEEQLYDDNCLKLDCITLQFGDGKESKDYYIPWIECDVPSIEESTDTHTVKSVNQSEESMPKLENMTTTELCGWLKEIKIKDKYIKYFEEHDINGSVLITCEADDLKGLGISEGFIRKKIVAKCKAPVSAPLSRQPSEKATNMSVEDICIWLRQIKVDEDYIKLFEENDIDGCILVDYDASDLEEMGISKGFVRKKVIVQFRQIT